MWKYVFKSANRAGDGRTRPFAARRGLSLMEMAIVLGVCGIVLGGLWATVNMVMERVRREQAFEQITFIVRGVRNFYSGRESIQYTTNGIDASVNPLTEYLIRNGIIPGEMVRDRSASPVRADLPWGRLGVNGNLIVNGGFQIQRMPGFQSFRIILRGLKQESCVALATRLANSGPSGIVSVEYNNSGTAITVFPVSVTDARNNCNNAPEAIGRRLDLVYKLRTMN